MDNSLLAVRDINHKYIVVDRKKTEPETVIYYSCTDKIKKIRWFPKILSPVLIKNELTLFLQNYYLFL